MTYANALIPIQLHAGSIDAYIATVNRLPMLSAEEELRLAKQYRETEDVEAAKSLVLSHRPPCHIRDSLD